METLRCLGCGRTLLTTFQESEPMRHRSPYHGKWCAGPYLVEETHEPRHWCACKACSLSAVRAGLNHLVDFVRRTGRGSLSAARPYET